MGRVKGDGKGGFYWDENDTGPDQSGGTWSPGQPQPKTQAPPPAAPKPPQDFSGWLEGKGFDPSTMDPSALSSWRPEYDAQEAQSRLSPEMAATGFWTPPNQAAPPPPATPVKPLTYANIPGFDYNKTISGGGEPGKYSPAFRLFSSYIGGGGQVARNNLGGLVAHAKANGFPNTVAVGDDKVDFGDGFGAIDVVQSNGTLWFNNQPTSGPPSPSAPAGAAPTTRPLATAPFTPQALAPSQIQGAPGSTVEGLSGGFASNPLYDILMRRAKQSLEIDPNDPIIRRQTDAFGATQTRGMRNYLSNLAERGGPYDNLRSETRAAQEKVNQNTGALQAQLMQSELTSRRQEIQSALIEMGNLLTADQQLSLQRELSSIDAALRQQQISNQSNQFDMSLSQREAEFARELAQRGFEFDSNDQFRNSPLGVS